MLETINYNKVNPVI